MRHFRLLLFIVCGLAGAQAQTLSNSALKGAYFARHVQFSTDAGNNVTDARSIIGTMTFDGAGFYSFTGQQVIGTAQPLSYTTSGAYSVSASGIMTLSNPQVPGQILPARYAAEAVLGSSTESAGNTFDFFIAIPAPLAPNFSAANADSNFFVADFELTGASTATVRSSFFSTSLDGSGNVNPFNVTGHLAGENNGDVFQQGVPLSAYTVNGDGTGTLQFTLPANIFEPDALLSGELRTMLISRSGNIFIAGNPAAHDLVIGVKSFTPPAGPASVKGRYWRGGLRVDLSGTSANYLGSVTAVNARQALISGRRVHASAAKTAASSATTFTEALGATVNQNGTFTAGSASLGLGVGGGMFVGANLNRVTDYTGYEIQFGVAIPAVSGSGVFVNPQGIVNAASNVPVGDPVSPGEFIAIYGSGLAAATAVAPPPYPSSLAGVSVTINGVAAPIYLVSATQINCLVPYGALQAGATSANITVTSGGIASNTATVPVAATSPGVFSLDTTGTGDGAILHADNTVVSALNPAKRGEVVQLFMTGLGALTTPVPDGQGATAVDPAKAPIQITVAGVAVPAADIAYAGLASLPGLYQVNFKVPANIPTPAAASPQKAVAIRTPEALHSEVVISLDY